MPAHRGEPPPHKVEPHPDGYFLVTSARSGAQYRVIPTGGENAECQCLWAKHNFLPTCPCSHVWAVRAWAARQARGGER